MIKLILLMTIQSIFLVFSQIMLKFGIINKDFSKINFYLFINLLVNYKLWISLLSMLLSFFIWLYVIKNYKLSIAYPLVSISYIFMMMSAKIFFHESILPLQWIGVFVIMIGIFLITRN